MYLWIGLWTLNLFICCVLPFFPDESPVLFTITKCFLATRWLVGRNTDTRMPSRQTCSAGTVYQTEKWKWRDDGAICFSLSYASYFPRNFQRNQVPLKILQRHAFITSRFTNHEMRFFKGMLFSLWSICYSLVFMMFLQLWVQKHFSCYINYRKWYVEDKPLITRCKWG